MEKTVFQAAADMMRISITGPESTGKSWLAEHLAAYYHTLWVPEFARQYLERTGGKYAYEDILNIARGQFEHEENAASLSQNLLFCDTDFLVIWIWSEVKYGETDPWIEQKAKDHQYDLYLLCNIDLPWEYDPMREHPEMRQQLFEMYLAKIQSLGVNYAIISGTGQERLENARSEVEKLLKSQV